MPANTAQISKWRTAIPVTNNFFLPKVAHRPALAHLIAEVEVTPATDGTHTFDEKPFTHLINDSTFPLCASCASLSKVNIIDVTGADCPWQFPELMPLEVLLITGRFHTATKLTVSTTGTVTLWACSLRNDCAGVLKVNHLSLDFPVLRCIARVVCADGAPILDGHYLRNLSTFLVHCELIAMSILWLMQNNYAYRNVEMD
ncbi:hypothetical protein Hypma_002023 [Hypsizygus marmoreus]|uniref:DUF6570 domain-containing protein n=1 Tax=Hypsizygus marmoreus TaxID=39966 RepID=A0A369JBD5_HYPMA|nr:hypothetical protein Hypma_002023 [Hypsizygus marmoreus]